MIYFYLTKRDKKDVILIAMFRGQTQLKKVESIDSLNLPFPWKSAIENELDRYKMNYDAWIESANDVNELRHRIKQRGFVHVPILTKPLVSLSSIPSGHEEPQEGVFRRGTQPPLMDAAALRKIPNHSARK